MTDSFQAHKDDATIIEPSACDAFRACEETVLRCMCSVCGCPVYTPRRCFWNSFQETEITTTSQMTYVAMSSNSFAIRSRPLAKLKMKMKTLPTGFPVALCNTAIQFFDRHSNRSFLLLRIADFVVDAVDVVDVSVSEIDAFPPGDHLAFSGITYTPSIIVSSLTFLLHQVFLSFLIRQRMELILGMNLCPSFCIYLPKFPKC